MGTPEETPSGAKLLSNFSIATEDTSTVPIHQETPLTEDNSLHFSNNGTSAQKEQDGDDGEEDGESQDSRSDSGSDRAFSILTDEFQDINEIPFLEGRAMEKKVVVALDFGSTHSGFSYALTGERVVKSPPQRYGLFKEPTTVLFNPLGNLVSFGFKAREDYVRLIERANFMAAAMGEIRDLPKEHYYFDYDKLKMRLYNDDSNLQESFVQSRNGARIPLMKLLAALLGILRKNSLNYIRETENMPDLQASDVLWVLTVPAIWKESDKLFMRRAAVKARLIAEEESPDLVMALEPECAAIRLSSLRNIDLKVGDKAIVLDCGGGTVDICALQVSQLREWKDEKLAGRFRFRQLLPPSGGNWGSTYIDDKFFSFLKELFGANHYYSAMMVPECEAFMHDRWEEIKYKLVPKNFVDKPYYLKTVDTNYGPKKWRGAKIDLKLMIRYTSVSLNKLVEKYNSVHKHKVGYRKKMLSKSTWLVLTPAILRTFFDPVIRKTFQHLKNMQRQPELKGLKHVILVGGLGQNKYLHFHLSTLLKNKLTVPHNSSGVVMKGAVEYGLQPGVIESRRSAMTIGIKTVASFDPKKEYSEADLEHKVYDSNTMTHVIRDVFLTLVVRGDEVEEASQNFKTFKASPGTTSIKFEVFASLRQEVHYVTDPGCVKLGSLIVAVDPDASTGAQEFRCSLAIGYTELFAVVINVTTGETQKMRIDFDKKGEKAVEKNYALPQE